MVVITNLLLFLRWRMGRILGLDGIRAYAVLMVVVTHMHLFIELNNSGSPYYSLVRGIIGVQIFFVLSGLLITNLLILEHKNNGRISIKNFIIRRGLRIFPVFYLFIFVLFITGLFIETNTSLKQLFFASIYWFNHLPRSEYNILLGHTWSLAVEEHFYLIWPPILIFMYRLKFSINSKILILILAIYSLQILQDSLYSNEELVSNYNLNGWTSSAAIYLLTGCIGGLMLHSDWWERVKQRNTFSYFLALVFISGFFINFWYEQVDNVEKYFRLFGILAGILWVIINQKSFITKFLELKPIAYIGQVSYGIYLWQGFFIATGPGRWNGQEWPPEVGVGINSLTGTGFILLCVTVPISYHLFEIKFLRLKERFRPNVEEE